MRSREIRLNQANRREMGVEQRSEGKSVRPGMLRPAIDEEGNILDHGKFPQAIATSRCSIS